MHEKIDAQQIQVTKNGDFTQTLHYEMVIWSGQTMGIYLDSSLTSPHHGGE